MFLLNKNLLNNLVILRCMLWSESGKIFLLLVLILLSYIVGVGLVRPFTVIRYIAPLQRIGSRALSVPLFMYMSEAFSVPFCTSRKLCYTKALE